MTNACFSHIPTELHTTSAPSPQSVLDALHDAAPGAPALSVWATAQSSPAAQRAGRYVPESTAHPANMLPAVAAHAILHYTQPGDLVLDPMCGMGTTLVEAIHTGRRALGVEYERHWVGITRANLAHVGHHRLLAGFTRILAATRIFLRPGDLRDIDWDTAERVDVLTAGFPCQDISAAGKRAGIELAQRSGLWHDIVEAVRVLRPALLTVENVAVLRWRNGACTLFSGTWPPRGMTRAGVAFAADVGAPHYRERRFLRSWPRVDNRHDAARFHSLLTQATAAGSHRAEDSADKTTLSAPNCVRGGGRKEVRPLAGVARRSLGPSSTEIVEDGPSDLGAPGGVRYQCQQGPRDPPGDDGAHGLDLLTCGADVVSGRIQGAYQVLVLVLSSRRTATFRADRNRPRVSWTDRTRARCRPCRHACGWR
ncbi:DNA methylase [Streptoalloteichus tenebrarius]|uniref:Methyltransferase n=1 Tax=Streptoalloteichus tenebrarius (strain ATCC 17920 / DSM 40477 / JCM 4838 / CBS 697.72 / NBRC 16177 / NCIMB 11028 / NRRL B-12390 / A12253. 1 / ISP 5477) TaxID=1933 RepID=A0ABT1I0P2_STRSD|nr:DNA cytosine methyltransferase [Streptoalloteichus tenebrarius]MCP2261311.1 DNA methylase [Streptoalloteichus tenebrarius]